MTIGGAEVRAAAELCCDYLWSHLERDWTAVVADVDMEVIGVVAHAAEAPLWYAIDLSAGGADLQTVEHRVKTDRPPAEVIDTLAAYARICVAMVESSPTEARGFHPWGSPDPSGFAAMACNEMLIHTHDAARGLGADFEPPAELAAAVLARLFPWVGAGDDPWQQLLWACGRIALRDAERLATWAAHPAPLSEWDGKPRVG